MIYTVELSVIKIADLILYSPDSLYKSDMENGIQCINHLVHYHFLVLEEDKNYYCLDTR